MRTRLVRVRKRSATLIWAFALLAAASAAYLRVSLPAFRESRDAQGTLGDEAGPGERVTQETTIEGLQTHLISFGGYGVMSSARVEAARYVSRGAAGYVLEGERLEVIGAGYDSKEEAERVCAQLAASEGMQCRVISLESPRVVLRMTAGSEQILAFSQGEAALREAAAALGRLAFSIDRREAGVKQAGQVIESQLKRVQAAREALQARLNGQENELFGALLQLLAQAQEQMEQMFSETSGMGLSSRLKYAYVDLRAREIEMLNDLLGQGLQSGDG